MKNEYKCIKLAVDMGLLDKKHALRIININKYGTLKCELCKKRLAWGTATIDHIIPQSKLKKYCLSNLRLTHKRCNVSRGSKISIKDILTLLKHVSWE